MGKSNLFKIIGSSLREDNLEIEKMDLLKLNELISSFNFKEEYLGEKVDIKSNLFHKPNGIHGVTHAERVLFLALAISYMEDMTEENRAIIIMGAKYHDIGRGHDTTCLDHGAYGYIKMKRLGLLDKVSSKDEEIIKYIIENHCIDDLDAYENVKDYNVEDINHAMELLNILKDADNLDRVRIDDLDISYLRTNSAKELVEIAYELYNNKTLE